MKRVLFVDDESRVLDGLRRILHRQRNAWEMVFMSNGQAALDEMEKHPFDVLVSDMRMPQMDGATLLSTVQQRFPNTVRIILSGYSEMEAALRAVPVAHQFLSKPCNPEQLVEVIRRASGLQELLANATLRQTIGRIKQQPSFTRTYRALVAAIGNPDVSKKEESTIVEQDAGLCAKLLQLVNSAFFGLSRRVTNIETAVSLLGTNMVKNVVLSIEVFQDIPKCNKLFSTDNLQRHCFLTGTIARALLKDPHEAEDAFIAGVLHDLGEVILLAGLPDTFEKIVRGAAEVGEARHTIENAELQVTHAMVGAYLLGLWGLPYAIVEAVAHHHGPRVVDGLHIRVLAAVHVADRLVQQTPLGDQDSATTPDPIDSACLDALGGPEQLPAWRKLVETQGGAVQREPVSGS